MLANGKHRRSSLAVSTEEWSEKSVKSKDKKFSNLTSVFRSSGRK